jgi:RND family efflux transporter MFP subunit
VVAAPENESTVVATAAGRLHYVGNLVAGRAVSVKDALFVIDGSGVTENDAAVKYAAAESKYMFAKADYERKLSLYGNNIVSQKDLQAAEALLRESEAHYNSMKQTFNNGNLLLKSDVDGFVATLLVENGEYVQAGTPLAVLQKEGGVNIEAELPIRYAQSLRNISSVNVELADGTVLSLDEINGNVLAVGRAANECNMIPVTVTAKQLPAVVGSVVTMHMAMALPHGGECVAVPRTALVEEMGNYFVFVQVCSEDFEKREVKIGNTDGKYTQILKGVHKGEKVVSKGAVSLKLSQSAGALDPHAGHVH